MPSTPSNGGASYRTLERLGPDPVTEADVIAELMHLTTRLRRKLLVLTLAASGGGGVAMLFLYVSFATRIYGRVCGFAFAVGALVTFALVRRLCGVVARRWEARWIAEFAGRHALEPGPLAEALGMFTS